MMINIPIAATTTMFEGVLLLIIALAACLFLFLIKDKTKATWLFLVFFICMALVGFARILEGTLGGILFVLLQDAFIIIGGLFLVQFAYHFPQYDQPREARIVLLIFAVIVALSLGTILILAIQAYRNPVGYVSAPEYFWYLMPLAIGLAVVLCLRRSLFYAAQEKQSGAGWGKRLSHALSSLIHPPNNNAAAQRNLAVAISLGVIQAIPSAGLYTGPWAIYMIGIGGLLVVGGIALVYYSHSLEPISFTAKLVGISLTALLIFAGINGINSIDVEQKVQSRLVYSRLLTVGDAIVNSGELPGPLPSPVSYLVSWPAPADYQLADLDIHFLGDNFTPADLNSIQGLGGPEIAEGGGHALHFAGIRYTDFLRYRFLHDGRVYETGSPYSEYAGPVLEEINKHTLLTVLGSLFILILFPFFFRRHLFDPLNNLLQGVKQADEGQLDSSVPVSYEDEIGTITRSFNHMMESLRTSNQERDSYSAELESAYKEMEQKVLERTAELSAANEHLVVARKQAEAANQAKGTFLAHMSHELRTPLNGILGYAQVLKRGGDLTPSQRAGLATIENNGDHLLALITDILDLSRVEAGEIQLQARLFHLPGLCSDMVELASIRAEQKGLIFADEIVPELPVIVEGDDTRLRQVLINLLGNAVRYTSAGMVTFRVRPSEPLERGEVSRSAAMRILFEVEDTGAGIAEDQIETIFQPFQQLGQTAAPEGAGLGLAISHGLVESMGGEIQVETVLDKGSRFWFELVLNVIDQADLPELRSPQTIAGFKNVDQKVLIVDDNRAVLISMLSPLGFELQEAQDGREALDTARSFQPDAIILDIAMPGMDGLEVARRIRQDPELKGMVIVAHSASVYDEDRLRTLASGCDAFLSKPVRFERLCMILETHLHLEPIFEDIDLDSDTSIGEEITLPMPPPDDIAAAMVEASKREAIKEIERQIARLKEMDEPYEQTAAYLQKLADEYDFEAITAYLLPYVEAKSGS